MHKLKSSRLRKACKIYYETNYKKLLYAVGFSIKSFMGKLK